MEEQTKRVAKQQRGSTLLLSPPFACLPFVPRLGPQAPMYLTLDGTSSYDRRFIAVTCH
jgi:hypothetical protein